MYAFFERIYVFLYTKYTPIETSYSYRVNIYLLSIKITQVCEKNVESVLEKIRVISKAFFPVHGKNLSLKI